MLDYEKKGHCVSWSALCSEGRPSGVARPDEPLLRRSWRGQVGERRQALRILEARFPSTAGCVGTTFSKYLPTN